MALVVPVAPVHPGLPEGTTLLDFGKWILTNTREVHAYLEWVAAQPNGRDLANTIDQAIALAQTSSTAGTYLRDPVGWIETYVEFPDGKRLLPYQADALDDMAKKGRLALRGPHSLGKSTLASLAVHWFANTRDTAGIDWKIPTTASHWQQLTHYLWPEIHKWSRFLRWDLLGRGPYTADELMTSRLKLDYGEAWAMASRDPNAIEGAHAKHILYLFDESRSIAPGIWDSAEGAFAGAGPETDSEAWALAVSVPGPPAGRFYDIHARKKGYDDWAVRHVKIEEAVAAGQVSATWVKQKALQWGLNSARYQQRVLGNFATSESNAVIPLEWVEAAVDRWHVLAEERVNLGPVLGAGLDIAREGDDESCLAVSTRDCVLPLIRPDAPTVPLLVGRVKLELSRRPGRPAVVVDADGIGAGYFDSMRDGIDYSGRVFAFHAAASPPWRDYTNEMVFGNMRAAAYWSLRDELDPTRRDFVPTLALPDDDLLIGDLTTPVYEEKGGGRYYIESKDDIKKRLGRSTDSGDAVMMARVALRWAARATITAAQHRSPTAPAGDLRRGEDAAGPNHGEWSPLTVDF